MRAAQKNAGVTRVSQRTRNTHKPGLASAAAKRDPLKCMPSASRGSEIGLGIPQIFAENDTYVI
jgi:hypothetical protein